MNVARSTRETRGRVKKLLKQKGSSIPRVTKAGPDNRAENLYGLVSPRRGAPHNVGCTGIQMRRGGTVGSSWRSALEATVAYHLAMGVPRLANVSLRGHDAK